MIEKTEGKRAALVTGVSGPIGQAVAELLETRGVAVCGIDQRIPSGDGWPGLFIQADIGWGPALPTFRLPFEQVDFVFHIAGGASREEVESRDLLSDMSVIDATLRNNFVSALDVLHATLGRMRPGGSITFTSSINALGDFGLPVYSSSKAALHGLAAALAPELADRGIRLAVAVLGTVDHPGVRSLHAPDPDHFERLRAELPGKRLMDAPEAAGRIVDLGLDASIAPGSLVIIDNGQLDAHTHRP